MSELDFPDLNDSLFEPGTTSGPGEGELYDTHDGILFCIELSDQMFLPQKQFDDKSQIQIIIESMKDLMSELIVVRPNSAVGCIFYNCEKEAKSTMYEFVPLIDVCAQWMKNINDLLEDISQRRYTLEEFFKYRKGQRALSSPEQLEKLFSKILEAFNKNIEGQKVFNIKRVFLFTDTVIPNTPENKKNNKVLEGLLTDLDENRINFTNFFIGTAEKPFDSQFYTELFKNSNKISDQDESTYFGPSTKPITVEEIKSRIQTRKGIKRVSFRCPLVLDEKSNFTIGIRAFHMISGEKGKTRYKLVYEKEDIRKEAASKRIYINSRTGAPASDDLKILFPYGNKEFELTDKSITQTMDAYSASSACLNVLGFISKNRGLKLYNNIEKSSFVTADDQSYEGSTKTLASLHRTLKKMNKVAVIWGNTRNNSNPALYLLWPTKDYDINEGFYLTKLPFLDEIRKYPPVQICEIEETDENYKTLTELTQGIISHFNLKNGYRPEDFRNPGLQKHYQLLHDYLLQVETKGNEVVKDKEDYLGMDDTLFKISQIRDRILEDSKGSTVEQRRLSKYLETWNLYYKSLQDEDENFQETKTVNKKPKLNL
ncbi:ATP-dependent DNA helicase YKU70 RNJ42_02365 [Nakaseomyces bracarensis]|uniref:ATP-dependent DNA helicase YKU70 n=1 Tax=Nakaseomyces bracarensis TaxID=273131 RepID=UPI003871005B